MRLKPAGKLIILILTIGIVVGFFRLYGSKLAPGALEQNSVVPNVGNLPSREPTTEPTTSGGGGATVAMPGSGAGCADKPEVRLLGYAWNAQMGLMFANGGPQATQGSLMCRHGVNLKFIRQDDNGKMQEALTAFATQLSQGNAYPDKGAAFV